MTADASRDELARQRAELDASVRDVDLLNALLPGEVVTFDGRPAGLAPLVPAVYTSRIVMHDDIVICCFRFDKAGQLSNATISYSLIKPGSLRRLFPRVRAWTPPSTGGDRV